jgi:alanyl-tRNA synthetase
LTHPKGCDNIFSIITQSTSVDAPSWMTYNRRTYGDMMARTSSSIPRTSAEIRQSFLDFFEDRGHTIVPSSSLIPGGDQTLLFTNAGMVQFKDVFLGTGSRPYTRVADSQKCMRVAGKHNDLEEVGRDDSHHTFFEMLGNWSFGDYYKKEAIAWAWELLTKVWDFPKDQLYATCFEDEKGEIPRDDEAAAFWRQQPGFNSDHVLFFGRSENFWEMADTGPCGPDSEIHFDRGPQYCDKKDDPDHVCQVNGDCQRYLELWNLVFIQYNRTNPSNLEPLPNTHVDTGMGFERVVSVLQHVDSNYKTDLFTPLIETIQALADHGEEDRDAHFTPYRVIADHARAATFLIADGVVPGNLGRNYVCRMIIRRASRFGSKIGLDEPFLAKVAETVVEHYGDFYPELERNKAAIYQTITDEEKRFQRTIDIGISHLMNVIEETRAAGSDIIPGVKAFDLYATHGLPLEITRDIAREHGADTDEVGFFEAMEVHRLVSGSDPGLEEQSEIDTELFRKLLMDLQETGALGNEGVVYDPYSGFEREVSLLAILRDGSSVQSVSTNDQITFVIPETPFYIEAGGQVADTGTITSTTDPGWKITVQGTYQPINGLVVHYGQVISGKPKVGDRALATIDEIRRWDIMRNHTATHLLHAALRQVLGEHVRQAGSLVAPDRLRFDFTHPEAMTTEQMKQVEQLVNESILSNYELTIEHKSRKDAIAEGAMALFGEMYGEIVRTVSIGDEERISYELCGGTHVESTGAIGSFLILSEGSVAAGIRRIEAITGRGAQRVIQSRLSALKRIAEKFDASPDTLEAKLSDLLVKRTQLEREIRRYRESEAATYYETLKPTEVAGVLFLTGTIPNADNDILRRLTDRFRAEHTSGVIVLASTVEKQTVIVAAVSPDLVDRGLDAGELVDDVAAIVGGGGGGKPTLAQAGGKNHEKLPEALAIVPNWIKKHLV